MALFQSKEVACVTASQTVRLITPHIHNSVLTDEDIIVTADVDAFIMTPDILKPLQDRPDVTVWIWEYYYYFITPMFPMSFIGARSRTWKELFPSKDLKYNLDQYSQR